MEEVAHVETDRVQLYIHNIYVYVYIYIYIKYLHIMEYMIHGEPA